MAANYLYEKHVPSYVDLDNISGKAPGFRVTVCENDGGVGLILEPYLDNPSPTINLDKYYGVFFNIKEAQELVSSLQAAIEGALGSAGGEDLHPDRVQDC